MKLIAGDNTFASNLSLQKMLRAAESKGYAIERLDGEELTDLSILDHLTANLGLFGTERVVLIKRPFKNKKLVEALEGFLENRLIVIWQDGKVDNRLKFVQQLKKLDKLEVHELPKPYELPNWTIRHAKQNFQIDLTPQQAKWIVDRLGTNLWVIDSELQKLADYSKHLNLKPGQKELETVLSRSGQQTVWDLATAFTKRKKLDAVKIIDFILNQGQDLVQILPVLLREFRILSAISYAEKISIRIDARSLSIPEFAYKRAKENSALFSWSELLQIYLSLIELDTDAKTGKIDLDISIKSLIFLKL